MGGFLKAIGIGMVGIGLLVAASPFIIQAILDEPLPVGTPGPEADALARKIQNAVGHEHWERTRALRFSFDEARQHTWDRQQGTVKTVAGDLTTELKLTQGTGEAWQNGTRLGPGEARDTVLAGAREAFENDAFWLYPMRTFFDASVTREVVPQDNGRVALLIRYPESGDTYLWHVDDDGTPMAWQMWVSVTPVGGLRAGWGDWITLSTGLRVSGRHVTFLFDVKLTPVQGAETVADLKEP